jgi:plasmid stability protein
MATSITIRNVSDETHDELVERARLNGQSLQEYLRAQLIELAKRPDMKALVARIEARVEKSNTNLTADQILELRDNERP